ncbi:hypothetical protein G6F57_021641 [Rhizopus arrhizus]|nr:hypothetical protein G6F57_021641 [Rhizopus arrhizus]
MAGLSGSHGAGPVGRHAPDACGAAGQRVRRTGRAAGHGVAARQPDAGQQRCDGAGGSRAMAGGAHPRAAAGPTPALRAFHGDRDGAGSAAGRRGSADAERGALCRHGTGHGGRHGRGPGPGAGD